MAVANKYQLLIQYIKKNKGIYFLGIFSVILCNFLQAYFPVAIGHTIDFFSGKSTAEDFFLFFTDKRDYSRPELYSVIFYSIFLSKIALAMSRIGWRICLARQTHLASGMLKNEIWLKARYFKFQDLAEKFSKGILMNAANSDVGQARFLFGFHLVGLTDLFFLGIFTVASMFYINVKLSLLAIFFLVSIPFTVKKISKKEIESYDDAQNALGEFNDLATQAVSTVKLQKIGKISLFWFRRLFDSSFIYMNKRLITQRTSLKYIPYTGLSSILSYVVLFSYGLLLNVENEISVGEFVSMQGLIFLLQEPLINLGVLISEWRKSATSLQRLNEIFDHESEEYLSKLRNSECDKDRLVYEVKDLAFSYGENTVINHFNIKILKNARMGITGQIGSGKTTLINILSGLERNFSGSVLFHQRAFSGHSHQFLRSHIVVVHQQAFLFADTIKNNIQIDCQLTDEEVWDFLKLAHIDEDVRGFKNGINTYLGEWGINLSGGQKQRLTLARALAKRPEVLLLDDALSAVDTTTEDKILRNLNEYLRDTTIIWVAHRKSTLKYCDVIIDMDNL